METIQIKGALVSEEINKDHKEKFHPNFDWDQVLQSKATKLLNKKLRWLRTKGKTREEILDQSDSSDSLPEEKTQELIKL